MRPMSVADSRVSFAELQQWPEDGRRYELYDGEVIVVPSPFPRHQRVGMHIGEVLGEYERASGGIVFAVPIDIVFTEYDVIQPDLVFFTKERRHLVRMWQETRVPPDWRSRCCQGAPSVGIAAGRWRSSHNSACLSTGLSIPPRT
jgi:Uma2 family endonuclease